MKKQKKEKNRKKTKKRDWAGPTGSLGGAAPGPHRPGWCIAPPGMELESRSLALKSICSLEP
jgi:hypothetical protein